MVWNSKFCASKLRHLGTNSKIKLFTRYSRYEFEDISSFSEFSGTLSELVCCSKKTFFNYNQRPLEIFWWSLISSKSELISAEILWDFNPGWIYIVLMTEIFKFFYYPKVVSRKGIESNSLRGVSWLQRWLQKNTLL